MTDCSAKSHRHLALPIAGKAKKKKRKLKGIWFKSQMPSLQMKIVPQTLTGQEFSWHAVLPLYREQECATHNCEIHEDKKVLLYKTMHRMSMTRHNQQQLTQISLLPKTRAKCQTWGIAQTTTSTQPYKTDAYEYLFLLSVLELKKLGHITCLFVRTSFFRKKMNQTSKITLMLKKRDKLSEKR